jgi:hypothetical protein
MERSPRSRKTWREKLEHQPGGLPKIVDGPPAWDRHFGGRRVLVPTPLLVDGLIRRVPKRKITTVQEIRDRLARDFDADSTCPLTTGICIRIAAETAEEDLRNGKKRVTPYWRVLKSDGSLNPKFPGGVKAQAARLREEGHTVLRGRANKPPAIKDFERSLQRL